jgi:hypothetical protein
MPSLPPFPALRIPFARLSPKQAKFVVARKVVFFGIFVAAIVTDILQRRFHFIWQVVLLWIVLQLISMLLSVRTMTMRARVHMQDPQFIETATQVFTQVSSGIVRSSLGFELALLDDSALKYSEGEHSITFRPEKDKNGSLFVRLRIDRWDTPYEAEGIDIVKAAAIQRNLLEAHRQLGLLTMPQ